jgi:hypothetical protein
MNHSRIKQLLGIAEQERVDHVQAILGIRGPLRAASFVTVHRKCGKPTCHCVTGEGHLSTYLSVKESGRTRMVYVPADLRQRLGEQALQYRTLRKHRAALAKLARRTLYLIDQLQGALETTDPVQTGKSVRQRPKSTVKEGQI